VVSMVAMSKWPMVEAAAGGVHLESRARCRRGRSRWATMMSKSVRPATRWWRRRDRWWCHAELAACPVALAPPTDRIGTRICQWGLGHVQPWRACPHGPHLLYIVLRDGGPPTTSRLDVSDQGAIRLQLGPTRSLDRVGRDQS
jgi:hypothetical protein